MFTLLNWILILCGIWQGLSLRVATKKKDKCYEDIGLCAQNIDNSLGSTVNVRIGSCM